MCEASEMPKFSISSVVDISKLGSMMLFGWISSAPARLTFDSPSEPLQMKGKVRSISEIFAAPTFAAVSPVSTSLCLSIDDCCGGFCATSTQSKTSQKGHYLT